MIRAVATLVMLMLVTGCYHTPSHRYRISRIGEPDVEVAGDTAQMSADGSCVYISERSGWDVTTTAVVCGKLHTVVVIAERDSRTGLR